MRKRTRPPSSAALERDMVRVLKASDLDLGRLEEISRQWFAACMRERRAAGKSTFPDPVAQEEREERRLRRGPRPSPVQLLEALRPTRPGESL